MNREQLNAFLKSDLMQWLLSAREVQRELTFGLFFPMQDLTARSELSDQLRDQTIFVQGSIDLLITLPSGKRILIDYKTDRLTERELTDDLALTEKMKRSHGYQLACYAKAVETLFGSLPDEVRIYSLPAGRTVAIPLEEIL